MADFNRMQSLKRRLFAMRNGALGEQMRRSGAPYRIIFGVNLPQLVEIARDYAPDRELAEQLRANVTTRESMLLAPMIYPREELDYATALAWLREVSTPEVADILCHRLLRHMPWAWDLAQEAYNTAETPLQRYAALRLGFNLFPSNLNGLKEMAEAEQALAEPMTASLAALVLSEIEFLME
ncbi:MAG: DNA alkylation repair protein [Bacteroidales bacterium]|nr:DNA alkylation repair protein [Bacteroidales bacterium]